MKNIIDALERKVCSLEFQKGHSTLDHNPPDVPDYNIAKTANTYDSRLSHKPQSMAEIVDTVVELKRYACILALLH